MAPVGGAGADGGVIDFDQRNPRTSVMPASEPDPRRNIYAAVVAGVLAVAAVVAILVALLGGGGTSAVIVPNVVGDSIESATERLEELGLIVTANPVARDDVDPGEVYGQDPPEGTELSPGDPVTVTYNPAPDPVPVPAVQTKSVAEATEILREAGFELVVDSTREDPTLAPGLIIEQIPAAGELLRPGEAVRVIVSGGAGQVVVPDVANLSSTAAQAALRAAPFRFVVEVLEEPSATVARGNAVRTDPPVGSPVDAGRAIRLYISSGPQPVPVPDMEGELESFARTLLADAQLGVDVRYTDVTDPNLDKKVITQGTPANQLVPPGTVIVLTVGRLSGT
jgi:serine/threonine-protein kinase